VGKPRTRARKKKVKLDFVEELDCSVNPNKKKSKKRGINPTTFNGRKSPHWKGVKGLKRKGNEVCRDNPLTRSAAAMGGLGRGRSPMN